MKFYRLVGFMCFYNLAQEQIKRYADVLKVEATNEELEVWLRDGEMSGNLEEITEEEFEAVKLSSDSYKLEYAQLKREREELLVNLTVTSSQGNEFDANNQARQDISDAISVAETMQQTTTVWRLANNNEVEVTLNELREVQALALLKYAQVKAIGEAGA